MEQNWNKFGVRGYTTVNVKLLFYLKSLIIMCKELLEFTPIMASKLWSWKKHLNWSNLSSIVKLNTLRFFIFFLETHTSDAKTYVDFSGTGSQKVHIYFMLFPYQCWESIFLPFLQHCNWVVSNNSGRFHELRPCQTRVTFFSRNYT